MHRASRRAAARFGAEAVDAADAGRGAALVVIATPDAAIREAARVLAPSLEPGALVLHLSGALGLDALDAIATACDDVELGALHPLQTLPSPEVGATRLAGVWAGVAGPPAVRALAEELGMTPFELADGDRAALPRCGDDRRPTTSPRCSARSSASPRPRRCPSPRSNRSCARRSTTASRWARSTRSPVLSRAARSRPSSVTSAPWRRTSSVPTARWRLPRRGSRRRDDPQLRELLS